jgi:hypothetical protein
MVPDRGSLAQAPIQRPLSGETLRTQAVRYVA